MTDVKGVSLVCARRTLEAAVHGAVVFASAAVPAPIRAQLVRRCCSPQLGPAGARWVLYIAAPGPVADWPRHEWAARLRHLVPTVEQRAQALAALGYELQPGAGWMWDESLTEPGCEHPQRVDLYASTDVRPLPQAGEAS